jgi:hypothetical protein
MLLFSNNGIYVDDVSDQFMQPVSYQNRNKEQVDCLDDTHQVV